MQRIKKTVLFIIFFIICSSAIINIFRQYSALTEARSLNSQINSKINTLKEKNVVLKNKIEYASSSAYIEQQARDKFGLGSKDDAWIILTEEKKTNLFSEAKTDDSKPNFLEWLELFTK